MHLKFVSFIRSMHNWNYILHHIILYLYTFKGLKKKIRINFPTTNVLGKSIQMNKKVQMQTCINLIKWKPKVGLHTKYYIVCGASTIFVEIQNHHVLTCGRILILIHIESEPHACIWPLFPAVIFEIVQQAFFFIYLFICDFV